MLNKIEASKKAMEYIAEMELLDKGSDMNSFRESSHMAVESVRHDEGNGVWVIGVGFVRDWNRVKNLGALGAALSNTSANEVRTLKTVSLNDTTGELVSYTA